MSDGKSAVVSEGGKEHPRWTYFLPEYAGIRESIQNSPFRWCVREAALWGIATGTAMGIHRIRMGYRPMYKRVIGPTFLTIYIVAFPSYYFCHKKREHKEKTIEMMMKANDFQNFEEMPEQIPAEQHPFLNNDDEGIRKKEFIANLKEKKEWQKQDAMKDASDVFREKK